MILGARSQNLDVSEGCICTPFRPHGVMLSEQLVDMETAGMENWRLEQGAQEAEFVEVRCGR